MKIFAALDDAIKNFDDAKNVIMSKNYDYLNQRNTEFDSDYDIFINKTNVLKQTIADMIEENFANIWETRQGFKFLTRFEKVSNVLMIGCSQKWA